MRLPSLAGPGSALPFVSVNSFLTSVLGWRDAILSSRGDSRLENGKQTKLIRPWVARSLRMRVRGEEQAKLLVGMGLAHSSRRAG